MSTTTHPTPDAEHRLIRLTSFRSGAVAGQGTRRAIRTRRVAVAAILGLAALTSCSTSGNDRAETSTTATSGAPNGSSGTTIDSRSTASTRTGGGSTTSSTSATLGKADAWKATAEEHRGQDGETFTYDCPAGGEAATIWGTETYSDDSSVCTAAVHVGLITMSDGGSVEIEIGPGLDRYPASIANGVLSVDYGRWGGSFTFPDARPGSGTFEPTVASWNLTASSLRLEVGAQAEVNCSPEGELASVYGTGTYTADSSICSAAVHSGLVDVRGGGPVRVEIVVGLDSYESTTAHGITSVEWGAYDPAFTFTDDQPETKQVNP